MIGLLRLGLRLGFGILGLRRLRAFGRLRLVVVGAGLGRRTLTAVAYAVLALAVLALALGILAIGLAGRLLGTEEGETRSAGSKGEGGHEREENDSFHEEEDWL